MLGRAAATLSAGAVSGAAAQAVACALLGAIWGAQGIELGDGAIRMVGLLAGFGAVVGAISAVLGERVFLRPLPIADLLDAWPTLFLIAFGSAVASTQWLLLFAWAVNPIVFFAGCAWIRRGWERGAAAR
jgi:hypothetical protein